MRFFKTRKKGIESRKRFYGRLFVLPWEIGIIAFFLFPLIQSVIYSLSIITLEDGFVMKFAELKHYFDIVEKDAYYTDNLAKSISGFLSAMPIIVILSLIIALILNQKFKGRIIARAAFFLPVIIATGVVIELMLNQTSNAAVTGTNQSYIGNMIKFDVLLYQLGIPENIISFLSETLANIFNLIWSCGIQIVLFTAGLQTIPQQLYEVSKVEGASKWEEFWFITLPMLSNVLLLVMIYTMIDLFTAENNAVMKQAYHLMTKQAIYDSSSAMLWLYFLIIGALMGIVVAAYHRFCAKRWEY